MQVHIWVTRPTLTFAIPYILGTAIVYIESNACRVCSAFDATFAKLLWPLFAFIIQTRMLVFFILVDGGWSQWGEWSSCSTTCDYGVKTRSRSCTDPVPQQNGNPCNGSDEDSQQCILSYCPGKTSPSLSLSVCLSVSLHLHCVHAMRLLHTLAWPCMYVKVEP